MRLFIAEKPELARAIVDGLGGGDKRDSHYNCSNGIRVTWCIGHLLELFDPTDYDEKYKSWDISNLPYYYYPVSYKLKDNKSIQSHTKKVINLIQNADEIVHAGDPDREGQLIIDSLLEYANYSGPVLRFATNDNTLSIIQKALSDLKSNDEFSGLSNAGKARMIADQLYGFNMTMAVTDLYRKQGGQSTLSVGRVQTPVLALIVNRTLANKSHKKSFYYTITAKDGSGNSFKLKATDECVLNESGEMIEKNQAHKLYSFLNGKNQIVSKVETKSGTKTQPLPYNIINLQIDASKKHNIAPDKTSEITQVLREKYNLITYNGTDCSYLNNVHHENAESIFSTVFKQFDYLSDYDSDFSIKGKCFNDSKVSAHHAIIPTGQSCDIDQLTKNERLVYELICVRYFIQFFKPAKFVKKTVHLKVNDYIFKGHCTYYTDLGYLSVVKPGSLTKDHLANYSENDSLSLPLNLNEVLTKPPKLYTYDSLLNELTQIAKYIENPDLKQILIEKDKGIAGENGGIGTPRTRDVLLKTLFERDFVYKNKKNILATKKGIELIQQLPSELTKPDMTALWHEQFKQIESGSLDVKVFLDNLMGFVNGLIESFKKNGLKFNTNPQHCKKCKSLLRRILKKDKSYFWVCTSKCGFSCSDDKGRPGF